MPIKVSYEIIFVTADGTDLAVGTALSGVLTVPAGETSVTLSIPSFDDQLVEGAETFRVVLSAPIGNAVITDAEAIGTINDNDVINDGRTCGVSWGDPHYVTLDGLAYDFQGVGEFVLVESSADDGIAVQTRTSAVGHNLSLNSAVATSVGSSRITIDTASSDVLRIDGDIVASSGTYLLDGGALSVTGSDYVITYDNGEILHVSDFGRYLNVTYCANDDREAGTLSGLLGNFDGDSTNDLATRDGSTIFGTQLTFNQLYDGYGDSWRITQDESLFDYAEGQDTSTFTEEAIPWHRVTPASLPADKVTEAEALLDAAGITDPITREAAIIDYAATCDTSFIDGAAQAIASTQQVTLMDPVNIWQNGGAVTIGSNGGSDFIVGTNAAVSGDQEWSGATLSTGWSQPGNWGDLSIPDLDDRVLFGALGAELTSIDQDFTIAGMSYTGEAEFIHDLGGQMHSISRMASNWPSPMPSGGQR